LRNSLNENTLIQHKEHTFLGAELYCLLSK